MTPASARRALEEGNQRFIEKRAADRDLLVQVEETRGGQFPFAVILGCIDSRVPPELVFDQGVGDVFVSRVAGNFVTPEILGSIEFGCKVAGSKLVVILGHRHCGAVKGACDDVKMGNLTSTLACIRPSVEATAEPSNPGARNSSNADFVHAVALENVRRNVARLLEESDVLREMNDAGEIDVVGAMYDVESGAVEFLG